MSQYARTNWHQFVDSEIVMVINKTTGKPFRFSDRGEAVGTFDEALEFVKNGCGMIGGHTSGAIIRLKCVAGFEIKEIEE